MNQDLVFEFSEHFDNALLHGMFGNNIYEVLKLFTEANEHLLTQLTHTRIPLTAGNWLEAKYRLHKLGGTLGVLGRSLQMADVKELCKRLEMDNINAFEVIASFKQIQSAVFSLIPQIHEEIKRMELYLNRHYPSARWNS